MKRLANIILLLVASFSTVFAITPAEEYSNSRMLVVCHEKFENSMKPFVLHKNELGMTTEMIVVKDVEDHLALKSIIEAYTKEHPDISYLLLVGDTDYLPHYYLIAKQMQGPADQDYNELISGCDFRVGRFSGESVEDIDAMVTRSILYEHSSKEQNWALQTVTVGSNNADTDYYENAPDYVHARKIGDKFEKMGLNSTVLVDLDTINLMSSKPLVNAINDGCSIINYTGHGEPRYWVTTGFSYEDAMKLDNANKWPFIFSTACVVGDFTDTCLAEGFLRSRDADGYPTGAVAMLASGANQPLSFPMAAQISFNNRWLTGEEVTFSKLCKVATDSMYNMDPSAYYTFLTWNLFGDPSQVIFPYNNEIIPSELTISTRIKGGAYDFNAENQISASNKISSDAKVTYRADNVVLKDGFHFSGDHFLASNEPKSTENIWSPNLGNVGNSQATELCEIDPDREITLYPIPCDGEFTIDFGRLEGKKSVMIYDVKGVLIYRGHFMDATTDVNLAAYGKGIYNIRITTPQISSIRQIIIK